MPDRSDFKVDTQRIPGGYLLVASGELDYAVAERLDKAFAAAGARSGDRLVLDLRSVRLIDSSGLASIIGFNTRANYERFEFVIVRPPGPVMRVFELTTLDRWLHMVDEYEPGDAKKIGADLDELSRRLERSQEALRSRRSVAAPSGDEPDAAA